MDTVPGLRKLEARKRELLLESDLNRQVLRLEVDQLCLRAAEIRRGFGWARAIWTWSGPLAGLLMARRFKKTGGMVAKGSMVMSAVQAGWRLWEAFRERRSNRAPEG